MNVIPNGTQVIVQTLRSAERGVVIGAYGFAAPDAGRFAAYLVAHDDGTSNRYPHSHVTAA